MYYSMNCAVKDFYILNLLHLELIYVNNIRQGVTFHSFAHAKYSIPNITCWKEFSHYAFLVPLSKMS
jgi:hypothetical protein